MERTQKEYYLVEQMKAIQKRAGDKEGKTGEVATLREKIEASGMTDHVKQGCLKNWIAMKKFLLPPLKAQSFEIISSG